RLDDASRVERGRDRRCRPGLRPGGRAGPCGGVRHGRDPRRARIPDSPVPVAAGQPALRRLWRQRGEAASLRARRGRMRSRQLARRPPLFMRLSVEDDAGWGPADSVALAKALKTIGVDVVDCSAGGILARPISSTPIGYGYQVPFAQTLREQAEIRT